MTTKDFFLKNKARGRVGEREREIERVCHTSDSTETISFSLCLCGMLLHRLHTLNWVFSTDYIPVKTGFHNQSFIHKQQTDRDVSLFRLGNTASFPGQQSHSMTCEWQASVAANIITVLFPSL